MADINTWSVTQCKIDYYEEGGKVIYCPDDPDFIPALRQAQVLDRVDMIRSYGSEWSIDSAECLFVMMDVFDIDVPVNNSINTIAEYYPNDESYPIQGKATTPKDAIRACVIKLFEEREK